MFLKPCTFQNFLSRTGHIDAMYEALKDDDISNVVLTALEILRKTNNIPRITPAVKNEELSTAYRNRGNNIYTHGDFVQALHLYNKALLFAPKNSNAMKLAYGNRSALLKSMQAYKECLNDIETCLSMGCPTHILGKLQRRKEEVLIHINKKDKQQNLNYHNQSKKIFQIDSPHTNIPYLSKGVQIIDDSKAQTLCAESDIEVGSTIAVENPYISTVTDGTFVDISCHYCHRIRYNLIPCDGCCVAFFCNDECKNKCYNEYHKYECQMVHVIHELCNGHMPNLMVKATLKIRSTLKSWKEIIEFSYTIVHNKLNDSEIFDYNNISSVFRMPADRAFMYGTMYNASFSCAALLHYMEAIPGFFPCVPKSANIAIKAIARIMIFLSIFNTPIYSLPVINTTKMIPMQCSTYGIYTIIGKIKKTCNPNVIAVPIKNKLALIALKPIKQGTKLTIGYLFDSEMCRELKHSLNILVFFNCGDVCDCNQCSGFRKPQILSTVQQNYFRELNVERMDHDLQLRRNIPDMYKKLSEALKMLQDVHRTKRYDEVYTLFRRCLLILAESTFQ